MFEIKDLHHVSLVVQDVERSRYFYCDILGMKDEKRPVNFDFKGAWFVTDRVEIHLIHRADATQAAGDPPNQPTPERDLTFARHFCFEINEVQAMLERLSQYNVPIACGPRARGDGATQTYIYDPDGHLVELVYVPRPDSNDEP